jgi:alkylated DNA repair protein alkB family protein 8
VKHYGFKFQYGSNKVDKSPLSSGIPVEMGTLINKFMEFGLAKPNQLTVNYYAPGQGIPLHIDTHSSFEDEIISVSLGSDIVMDFKNDDGKHVGIVLPRRSCLVMTKESR